MRLSICALFLPGALIAQTPSPSPASSPDSSARATAVRADRAPVIDGKEDDSVWRIAPAQSDFREFQPAEGKAPRFKTEFKAAYDERNLYVFIRAFDDHPDSIMKALSRRDVRASSDQVKIMLDSYFDRRNGYEFAVNPNGVKRDYAMYNDRNEDQSWDAIWDVGTRIDSVGWTAEYRIPLSQLRFADRKEHTFGIAIWRDIERYKERTSWPLYSSNKNGLVSQLGRLEGIRGIGAPHRLEVTPYTLAKNSSRQTSFAPNDWDRVQQGTVGADIKYGVTSNLVLDGTINPDFGQVEADPSVLNLSAFETFFQEKRPFFVEGAGTYSFEVNCNIVNCSGEGLFYSRRIGRSPQVSQYAGIGAPAATPILGAGKLTGRFPGGLSIGVLDAFTKHVEGTADRTMEPQTNYALLRAQQEYRGGGTTVGMIATSVNRGVDQWTDQFLRRSAFVVGSDFKHKLGTKYEVSGSLMRSQVSGEAAVIAATQRSSVHNYQRPDGGLRYDPSLTSLTGNAEEIHFAKLGGNSVFRFQTNYQRRSPGFEINDLGFLRRADQQSHATWAALQYRKPTSWYRSLQMNFNEWNDWTTGGMMTETAFNTNWHLNAKNNWWWHAGGTINGLAGALCDLCARGGPALRRSTGLYPWFGFNWDDRARVAPSFFVNLGRSDGGRSWYVSQSVSADIRPSSAVQLSAGLDYERSANDGQFFGKVIDGVGVSHYTFAHLEQKTVSFSTRASYTMSPVLTLQVYAAPFMTRGTYSNVRELSATPRATDYDARYQPYPTANPGGFNVKEMRSNTVLRWEYRPGSTMFVVWAHGREFFDNKEGTQSWNDEFDQLFKQHPDNTFLIKVAYWLSR